MNKILFVTGSRAEYGLLKDLMLRFQQDNDCESHIAVTGTHLSQKHGMTIDLIEKDGLQNLHKIDLNIQSDTPVALTQGITLGLNQFAQLLNELKPNMLIVLGDRYELWSATMAATIANVPIVHIHGGESTIGVIDEAVRHSITKMAHLHFCSHESYKKRIMNMGENPNYVWNVGAIGLDRIKKMNFLTSEELEKRLNSKLGKTNILCTFHPVTLDKAQSSKEITHVINVLEKKLLNQDVKVFITLPNADTFSNEIRAHWEQFTAKHPNQVVGFENLGDLAYLSLVKNVDLVMGNSSSGIFEAPFLQKAVLNIGKRQEGRMTSEHVVNSTGELTDLSEKLEYSLSPIFQSKLAQFSSIYGDGNTVEKIYSAIKSTSLEGILFKKFFDRI